MAIVPLGYSRVSVPFQTNRSLANLHSTQAQMSKYEEQMMTELQYRLGSDSPYNASTTLSVQAQIERKAQNASNIKSTQSFLAATDSTLSQINNLTDEARAMGSEAINTITSDTQRNALAQTVKQTIQQIYDFGNYSFEGRYVFSGSTTGVKTLGWGNEEYGFDSYTIVYSGTESNVFSWSDTDLLSQTNMNGADVFGAISDPVHGNVDVNPAINENSLLRDLNNGKGVEKGSIRLSCTLDGKTSTFDVDLSRCATLADVKRTLEHLGNPNFTLQVDLTQNGLDISLPAGSVGSVSISEFGKGRVADQLGILTKQPITEAKPLHGKDLNPVLTSTTSLNHLLGFNANTTLRFAGSNNDIQIKANVNGTTVAYPGPDDVFELNGVSVAMQSDTNLLPGEEWASFDAETRQILVHIHPDSSTANDIITAINRASGDGSIPPFTAALSTTDQDRSDVAGTGLVPLLPGRAVVFGTTTGGTGEQLDMTGLQIQNGGKTMTVSFEGCQTVGDFLAVLNDPQYGLSATINDTKTGFDVRTRVSGTDFMIGENGGITASQLGIRTLDLSTPLSELDYGRGVNDYEGPGINATATYAGVAPNSSLKFTARNEGEAWNDYVINFVPTNDPQGKVVVSMDEDAKTITIGINPGVTTACDVVAAFNEQPGPKQYFDIELDQTDLNTGAGVVYDGFTTTADGEDGGIDFTITRNDGTKLKIDIHNAIPSDPNKATTIEDILRIINECPPNDTDHLLEARLAADGNGIELIDNSFGNSVTRVDRAKLSTAAIELGLVNQGEEYRVKTTVGTQASATITSVDADGNQVPNSSLLVIAKNVGEYANDVKVEIAESTTGEASFQWDAQSKTMRFSVLPGTTAEGIVELFDQNASETVRSMFSIQNGVNADGQPSNGTGVVQMQTATLSGGENSELLGNDPNPKEAESLYTALIRLQTAMEKNDSREIERAAQMLDTAVSRLDNSRAEIGVRQNSLDTVQNRLSEEYIQHEETLNNVFRIDYTQVTMDYLAQQLALQASMQVTSAMFQMTLLNYI